MQAYFESIDLDVADAWTLFKLLDSEGVGCISIEAFITGCLNLRGQAKAVHIAKLMHESERSSELLGSHLQGIGNQLSDIKCLISFFDKSRPCDLPFEPQQADSGRGRV